MMFVTLAQLSATNWPPENMWVWGETLKKLLALMLIIIGTVLIGAGLMAFAARPLGAMMALLAGATCWVVAWRVDRKPKIIVPEGVIPLPPAEAPVEVRRQPGKIIALAIFFGLVAAVMALPVVDEILGLGRKGWPLAVLAGVAVAVLIPWSMLRHAPYLRIDAMGFTGPGQRLLPWREIEGVRLFGVTVKGQTHHYLHLRLARPAQHVDRVSGLGRWRLKKQGILHYSLKFIDTDLLVIFEALSRRIAAAHDGPVLSGFRAESQWLPWVQTHVKFGQQDAAPAWQERVNALHMAINGGWSQYDDFEASGLKLKLQRAEHAQREAAFARLDQQLEAAVARQAGEPELQQLFASVMPGNLADSADVAGLKQQLAIKARKTQRNTFISVGVVGVLIILYVWFRFVP